MEKKLMIKVEFPLNAMLPASSEPTMNTGKLNFTYIHRSGQQQNDDSTYSTQPTSSFPAISDCTFEGTVTFANEKAAEVT